jgi:hypothetical protein
VGELVQRRLADHRSQRTWMQIMAELAKEHCLSEIYSVTLKSDDYSAMVFECCTTSDGSTQTGIFLHVIHILHIIVIWSDM